MLISIYEALVIAIGFFSLILFIVLLIELLKPYPSSSSSDMPPYSPYSENYSYLSAPKVTNDKDLYY